MLLNLLLTCVPCSFFSTYAYELFYISAVGQLFGILLSINEKEEQMISFSIPSP